MGNRNFCSSKRRLEAAKMDTHGQQIRMDNKAAHLDKLLAEASIDIGITAKFILVQRMYYFAEKQRLAKTTKECKRLFRYGDNVIAELDDFIDQTYKILDKNRREMVFSKVNQN